MPWVYVNQLVSTFTLLAAGSTVQLSESKMLKELQMAFFSKRPFRGDTMISYQYSRKSACVSEAGGSLYD